MTAATNAGSLPKPHWLAETEKLWPEWRQQGDALDQAKRDAALLWLKIQEDAGLDVVTDGEQFRAHFVHGFLQCITGIDWDRMTRMGIRDDRYIAEVPTVTGPVSRPAPVHVGEAAFLRAHTDRAVKWTMPGPMTICDTIADAHYGSRPEMAMAFAELLNAEAKDLADAGVDVIQFDEPAFNVFTEEVAEWGVAALDRAVRGVGCLTAVHVCYGYGIKPNIDWKQGLGDEWRQYDAILPAINRSQVDQISLEAANSRVPLSLMGHLSDKVLQIGVIDVATDEIETPEQVAANLRAVFEHVDPDRVIASTNCGMAPLPRRVAEAKLRALGQGARLV
jgi:5-methyltetrahydropteroyltriglutamate--homocysteine methyltransferase